MSSPKRVVLAYSGGLDTSVILRWLIERYRCEVVAFCADLGQGEELIPIREKALRTGAAAVHIADLRERFVRDFVFPMLRANAAYEGGVREDAWAEPPAKMFQLTQDPEAAPDAAVPVEIDFERGDPVAVDGERLDPVALLTRLNRLGGEHGVGRVDLVENRFVGMKSRGVYETPGGTIVHAARRALESLTLDREMLHLRDPLVPRYAEMIYYGFWFAPERQTLQTLMDECAQDATGTVRLQRYKGNVIVVGRRSPRSLYRTDFATFEADTVYRQRDAEGFINLNALRLRIRALRDRAGS